MLSSGSSATKVLVVAISLLLVLCASLYGMYHHRGETVANLKAEVASQQEAISAYQRDKEAKDGADEVLRQRAAQLAKQRDNYAKQLQNALSDQECAAAPLPNDVKRVYDEIYSN